MRRRSSVLFVALLVLLATAACGSTTRGASPASRSDATTTTAVLAAPTVRPHRGHEGGVLIIGDSLTVGANSAGLTRLLQADGWTVEVDASEGRSTRTGVIETESRTKVPALVVVELGTNPSSAIGDFPSEIATMVDELKAEGAQRIIWITTHYRDDDRYSDKNNALARAAAADPTLVIADWDSLASAHPEWMRTDGLHYSDAGYLQLAAFLTDAIDANDPAA